mmetsp:Transcript_7798/g.22179  ORF Transcript_7798/g.22179 Transcript_7798/m.22179 type:complete len:251 (-) Transcript_7798:16-768(-)
MYTHTRPFIHRQPPPILPTPSSQQSDSRPVLDIALLHRLRVERHSPVDDAVHPRLGDGNSCASADGQLHLIHSGTGSHQKLALRASTCGRTHEQVLHSWRLPPLMGGGQGVFEACFACPPLFCSALFVDRKIREVFEAQDVLEHHPIRLHATIILSLELLTRQDGHPERYVNRCFSHADDATHLAVEVRMLQHRTRYRFEMPRQVNPSTLSRNDHPKEPVSDSQSGIVVATVADLLAHGNEDISPRQLTE